MKYKLKDISKGDFVTVDNKINGTIDSVEKDIKNGIPGIDYTTEDNQKSFCYLEQITNVVKKPKNIKVKTVDKVINNPSFEDLDIGDSVFANVFGGGTRTGIITDVVPKIKNGIDGISFDSKVDGSCWCYVTQIKQVTKQIPIEKKTTTIKKKM